MRPFDLAMIVFYALAMLAIGRFYKHRTATADDYLLGEWTMSPFMIGLLLFATLTSTLSYLALVSPICLGTMTLGTTAADPGSGRGRRDSSRALRPPRRDLPATLAIARPDPRNVRGRGNAQPGK